MYLLNGCPIHFDLQRFTSNTLGTKLLVPSKSRFCTCIQNQIHWLLNLSVIVHIFYLPNLPICKMHLGNRKAPEIVHVCKVGLEKFSFTFAK
jgi:hypothetical protein